MGPLRESAFYLLLWRAVLAALIGLVLMVTGETRLGPALLIGAHIALLFALAVVAWSEWMTEERIARSAVWRMLRPEQRPAGAAGRRLARRSLHDIGFRFAQGASGVAAALSASALAV